MNRFFEVITIQKSLLKLLTEAATAMLQVLFGLILLTFYHPYFTVFGAFLLLGLVPHPPDHRAEGPRDQPHRVEVQVPGGALAAGDVASGHGVQVLPVRARCPWTGWTTW